MKIYSINTITNEILEFEAKNFASLSGNYNSGDWREATQEEVKTVVLEKSKKNKLAEIENNKKDFIYSPIEYNGSTFINSQISSANLQGAYTFSDEPINWLDINGDTVVLSKIQIEELANLIIAHRASCYFQESSKLKEVALATTIEEVDLIDENFN